MKVQDLTEKYGMSEVELYVYAFNHLKNFKKRETQEQTWKLSDSALRQLDWLLSSGAEKTENEMPPKDTDDDWTHDPTEDEPDDSQVPPPMIEEPKDQALAAIDTQEEWNEEKSEMKARIEALQQELASLRQTHLAMQSDTANKQTELLAKAIHEKQVAESKIAALKEDAASVKHLSNIRIKELEQRNSVLEKQLKDNQIELNTAVEKLIKSQHAIQEVTDAANKEGAAQKLELLEAQHLQDDLYKAIHEKEIALTEEKEKAQSLMEKYNGALQRIGEIVSKVEQARTKMKEISAEFDVYINSSNPTAEKVTEDLILVNKEQLKPTTILSPQPQTPNVKTIEVLGKPLQEIQPQNSSHQEQVILKQNIWRKIASFF